MAIEGGVVQRGKAWAYDCVNLKKMCSTRRRRARSKCVRVCALAPSGRPACRCYALPEPRVLAAGCVSVSQEVLRGGGGGAMLAGSGGGRGRGGKRSGAGALAAAGGSSVGSAVLVDVCERLGHGAAGKGGGKRAG